MTVSCVHARSILCTAACSQHVLGLTLTLDYREVGFGVDPATDEAQKIKLNQLQWRASLPLPACL